MKIRHPFSIAMLLLSTAGFTSAATYTYSSDWNVAVSQTITGTTINATASQGSNSFVYVPYFNTNLLSVGETLESVTIVYTAPKTGVSSAITATIGSATGSNFFNMVDVSVSTTISSAGLASRLTSVGQAGSAALFSSSTPFTASDSEYQEDLAVSPGTPASFALTRDYDLTRFSSTNAADLTAFSKDTASNITFTVGTNQAASYLRTSATNDLEFEYSGIDSGTITVTYTTVPEPMPWMMLCIGLAGTLLVRRRSD